MYAITKDFLGKPAPPGYVAGLGRGATGFTTRSDIGPAREAATSSNKDSTLKSEDQTEQRFKDAENEEGLFSGMPYGADDEEADLVWTQIDAKMAQRREGKRKDENLVKSDAPAIEEHLRSAKRQLQTLTADEWAAIPDVAQLAETAARAKRRRVAADPRRGNNLGERMVQVPDSALVGVLASGGMDDSISARVPTTADDGAATDLRALGQARDAVLRMKLDAAGQATSLKSTDAAGYLTSLSSESALGIGDLARARKLLKSVTQASPTHAAGWIAAARLEEAARKPAQARTIIDEACERCPRSEDVWLEAARLHRHPKGTAARAVLSRAVRTLPQSVRVWVAAADAETNDMGRRRVLRRALEHVPGSVALWKAAVGAEPDPADARVLLAHAVETVPHSVDLWLALARLEPYAAAQRVLNRARRAVPTSAEVWIAAARLEEQCGSGDVALLLRKAAASLTANGAPPSRESWLALAQQAGNDGLAATCRAIIAASSDAGFDGDDSAADRAAAYAADAARLASTCHEAARALYSLAVDAAPTNIELWKGAAALEQSHGSSSSSSSEDLIEVLERAVQRLPQAEDLWLQLASCEPSNVDWGRSVLERAFAANPESEAIVLAAVALEADAGQHARAVTLLERAIQSGGSPRVWLKTAVLHRRLGNTSEALDAARRGRERFPGSSSAYKLWLIESQLLQQTGDIKAARQTLSQALAQSPRSSAELWLAAAALDAQSSATRARAVLERARVHIPRNPLLWLAAIRLESASGIPAAAQALIARALQECPRAGCLWAESVLMAERPRRKAASVDALKNAGAQDPEVCAVVARLFAAERRPDKARAWFVRATAADPDCGDAWAWWLCFESAASEEEEGGRRQRIEKLESACAAAAPRHGQVWPTVAKSPDSYGLSTPRILHKVAEALARTRQLS
ncbi:U4/U6 x U5 tri-snRNP complex subunit Prp1 [Coemansia pectinata]|uniref:U4/U6 x U5 tri-snRNP complex subunit Prp1 n=1 Tax=Coemansia pectinata TaxID=1052879 RepID=A0A9W8GXX7_9FUNG|nr:U4/U6 x U5 tri-snRNP complex subunit Prp1 [Coemansia pectinata]